MAAAKKKKTPNTRSAAHKKAPARKPSPSKAGKKKAAPSRQPQTAERSTGIELTGWLTIGLGVAALIVLLPFSGPENMIRLILNGLGGYLSFTLPFIIMWIGQLLGFSNMRRCNVGQIIKISCFALIFFGLFHIFHCDEIVSTLRLGGGWFNFVGESYAERIGGGAIGALIAYPFYGIAGEWGGCALLLFALIGTIFLITQISLRQMGARAQEYLSENYEDLRQRQSQRSAERAIEREERKRAAQEHRAAQPEWEPSWDNAVYAAADRTPVYEAYDESESVHHPEIVEPLNQDALELPARMRSNKKKNKPLAFGDPQPKEKPVKKAQKKKSVKNLSGKDSMHGSRKAPAPESVEAPIFSEELPSHMPTIEEEAPLELLSDRTPPASAEEPVYTFEEGDTRSAALYEYSSEESDEPVFDIPAQSKQRRIDEFDAVLDSQNAEDAAEYDEVYEEADVIGDDADVLPPFPTFGEENAAPRERRRKEMNKPLAPLSPMPDGEIKKPAPAPKSSPAAAANPSEYNYPPVDLLALPTLTKEADRDVRDHEKAKKLESTLHDFGINAKMTGIAHGPAVTRFELAPAPGVKVSRITSLSDDIALSLAALSVRIEAPIPGKAAVGVEIPNETIETVALREVLESAEARKHPSRLAVCMGKDNSGHYIVGDIAKMPHVLIAGATGSGKSVCINCIICSILYRATPDEVRLIMIDPKVVELSIYNGIPHLLVPVVTDPKKASGALQWAVAEMTERYNKFAERGVRDMKGYNLSCRDGEKPLPQIVIIIDELADLMMVAPGEVEDSICRLAQLARAAGIHLVIATQRPSVNVITGVIKANIPARIAFTVSSFVDSRTILDTGGAEKLLGRGDMLFAPTGSNKMQRVQGAWVSDDEVHAIVDYIKQRHDTDYNEAVIEHMNNSKDASDAEEETPSDDCDPLLQQAVETVVEAGQASISMLQRKMRIGYARAGRLIDEMAARGIVSQSEGAKPRNVLITREQFNAMFRSESEQ